ncbi:hypothetical protein [Flavobacterium sp. T12S277]|uniref:hypothetical protein n=1 Tax=Flavobacterium sp. T12S277 TaxID=3402752 RepID=UPI003ADDCBE0
MKLKFSLFLIVCLYINIYSQENISVEKNQFKINLILPGIVYEHGFTEKNTLYSEFSLGFGYRSSYFGGNTWSFYPNINEQFRHYYNLQKRADNGKRTDKNSGNFLALNAIYNFESISTKKDFSEDTSSFTIAPVWGFQRTYKGGFNLSVNGGIGYNIDKYDNEFVPVINFSLGWVIGK